MGRKGANRSGDGSTNFKNRIEGFGSGPMPPPIAENFEDRLHETLSRDETFGEWYNSARASVDAMVTAFDDTVNAIADTIEDTVSAVVGDDDFLDPEPQQGKNQQRAGNRNKNKLEKDDGERSEIKWTDVVTAICDEGNLDDFVLTVRSQCANAAEEREVAGLLSEHLLKAEKSSNVIRVLYVMQAVEEGELPVVIEVIRRKCQAKLEKLKTSTFFRALATQVLGPGPSKAEEEEETEQKKGDEKKADEKKASKAAQKPVDLLDMNTEPAKPAAAQAASSSGLFDLLDSAPSAAPAAKVDLLDFAAPASSAGAPDLLSLNPTPVLQPIPSPATNSTSLVQPISAPGGFPAFPAAPKAAPQQSVGQWSGFQSASSSPSPMGMPFQSGGMPSTNAGFNAGSLFGAAPPTQGYNQSFGTTPMLQPVDNFNPDAKPSFPSGPPIKVTGTSGARSAGTGAVYDSFATLDPFAGVPSSAPTKSQSSISGNSFGTGRSTAPQPAAKQDSLGLDDILSAQLKGM